jgi:hypothetical protein
MSELTEIDKAIYLMAQRAHRDPMAEAVRFQAALNEVRATEMYDEHVRNVVAEHERAENREAKP